MGYEKTIVCFANSRKEGERCVAGKKWNDGVPGEWIRPVSARPTHEVSASERQFQDGTEPRLLDIITIPFNEPNPISHQRENHLIDDEYYWVLQDRLEWHEIDDWLDHPYKLWSIGQSSSYGINNRVRIGRQPDPSLYLIEVERVKILVGEKETMYGCKSAVWGEFVYHDIKYRLDVTDPAIELVYLKKEYGQYDIMEPLLCVSLGLNYRGYYYKTDHTTRSGSVRTG